MIMGIAAADGRRPNTEWLKKIKEQLEMNHHKSLPAAQGLAVCPTQSGVMNGLAMFFLRCKNIPEHACGDHCVERDVLAELFHHPAAI